MFLGRHLTKRRLAKHRNCKKDNHGKSASQISGKCLDNDHGSSDSGRLVIDSFARPQDLFGFFLHPSVRSHLVS